MAFRDFLMRFRPTGLPGAAAAGGVPADRSAELRAELEPALAALDSTGALARTMLEAANHEAARRRETARRQAAEIVQAAHVRAEKETARVMDRERSATRAELVRIRAGAERELAELRSRVERRMPGFVDRLAADCTEALLGGPEARDP
ncbi:hypothetical protein [Actinacidiphila glaucinigra]|uniref:hypothetical protein n=1 Tax=Actinacidiphila glaucinigra TaxID=235986 RepID=UPI002E32F28E|nr:hypothetical protein [Actinacidiphila glaucinigra]